MSTPFFDEVLYSGQNEPNHDGLRFSEPVGCLNGDMSTPFSYGQLMPSVTKNFGSGPAEELTAHEYKTLWYSAVSDIESLEARWKASYNAVCDERDAIVKDNDKAHCLLRQALAALEASLSDDQPYIVQCKEVVVAIKEFME